MVLQEQVALAPHTTLRVGGRAQFFVECSNNHEVIEALSYAREHNLPLAILGGGANTLAPDGIFDGLVIKVTITGIDFIDEGPHVSLIIGAGTSWDEVVRKAAERGLWGIENLAGIPGTVGGAVVQNIGAYGAELSEVFLWAEVVDKKNGAVSRITNMDARFGYRTSIFKERRSLVITCIALKLSSSGAPRLSYPDLKKAVERAALLSTPGEIGETVRRIRALKFPHSEGTAGSFFKNPILTVSEGEVLKKYFPELPLIPLSRDKVKVPLAWILDRGLGLKGYARGKVRLFETQPLVLVTREGATAHEVDLLADEVAKRVHEKTALRIEREVETLGAV